MTRMMLVAMATVAEVQTQACDVQQCAAVADPLVNTECTNLTTGVLGWCIQGACYPQCTQDANRCLLDGVQWVMHISDGGACYCSF